MPRNQVAKALDVNPSLLAFKPRQVVLPSKPHIMKLDNANGNDKTLILNPEQQILLVHSIAQYLQRRGFSKTLKKFLSEAKIQKDELGDSSFLLEEMFCKFLDSCSHVSKNFKNHKAQELQTDCISRRNRGGDVTSTGELLGDGKKKKSDTSSGDKDTNFNNASELMTDDPVQGGVKSKEKKKNKNDSYSVDQEQVITKVSEEPDCGANDKSKDKKRKKNKRSSDPDLDEQEPEIDLKKDDVHSLKDKMMDKENKSSKKRKRVVSEEDAVQPAGEKLVEESKNGKKEKSKRRKIEGSEEPRITEESTELNSPTQTEEKVLKGGSNLVGSAESEKISAKQVNGLSNGSFEENTEKRAGQKTTKKPQNVSAEPKTGKHFQRIKADEVVFSNERLKDNSYWGKDGAEDGYGAKAQEVLGQVRGRDFRHEKTKKKRGSYRGGQIDLQSHSVKFNYSDDD